MTLDSVFDIPKVERDSERKIYIHIPGFVRSWSDRLINNAAANGETVEQYFRFSLIPGVIDDVRIPGLSPVCAKVRSYMHDLVLRGIAREKKYLKR